MAQNKQHRVGIEFGVLCSVVTIIRIQDPFAFFTLSIVRLYPKLQDRLLSNSICVLGLEMSCDRVWRI